MWQPGFFYIQPSLTRSSQAERKLGWTRQVTLSITRTRLIMLWPLSRITFCFLPKTEHARKIIWNLTLTNDSVDLKSSETAPLYSVFQYLYYSNFKTINIPILDVNTTKKETFSGLVTIGTFNLKKPLSLNLEHSKLVSAYPQPKKRLNYQNRIEFK